ncbi:adenosylcobinamide-phosphate synthase CbiB [Tahibacter caeni]|uniref:adenosylcobinamide-phosphate synthase CbiB n=1 Tax=Tahibacter caeni TaxID=1453545 RepID=UPI002147BA6C|nr:adenosylcobinamide-phosphate synthase CbiB [Tahibacter caeni]
MAALVLGLLLDHLLGEPRRWHPLVGFGRCANALEARLYRDSRAAGICAVVLAVAPFVLLAAWLQSLPFFGSAFAAFALYLALGLRSLREHAEPVADALDYGRLDEARAAVGRIVSRDSGDLDATQVATAATESVLENGNDAVFGALFWFAVAGAPGVVAFRLVNTLDALWGYRTERYERFGWAAAKLDDLLNLVPARLTALSYALAGRYRPAMDCWRRQAPLWDSPNAGPVMAAGAGALGVRLGGAAPYDGVWHERPALGGGAAPDAEAIRRALALVHRAVALWLAALLSAGMLRAFLIEAL